MTSKEIKSVILNGDIKTAKREARRTDLKEKRQVELRKLLERMYSEIQMAPVSQKTLPDIPEGMASLVVDIPVKTIRNVYVHIDMSVWPFRSPAHPENGSFSYKIVKKQPNQGDKELVELKRFGFSGTELNDKFGHSVNLESDEAGQLLDLFSKLMTMVHTHQRKNFRLPRKSAGKMR